MNEFDRMLTDPTKDTQNARGLLARLYRQILLERGVTVEVAHRLMTAWVNDPKNRVPKTTRGASSERGNLIKELSRETMSWKVFVKGMKFLRVPRITFIVRCHNTEKTYTEHGISVKFHDFNSLLDEETTE